jgi:hypothetical protein
LARPAGPRRSRWYRDYAQAIVERDVRDLARVQGLDVLPRLPTLAAALLGVDSATLSCSAAAPAE